MIRVKPSKATRYIAGVAALAIVAITCSDLTAPTGNSNTITIAYQGPPAPINGAVQLIVGQRLSPPFRVDLNGTVQQRARYVLSLPNLADTTVLRVFGNGDSVEVMGRGSATLQATLVGATITAGVSLDPGHRALINVVATPAANSVDSASLTFNSLGISKLVTGSSLRQDGSRIPLNANSLTWASSDPTIVGVTKITDSTALVTSLGNGTTTITATFDGIDVVSVPVTVTQIFRRFQLSTAAFGFGEVTLVSLGQQITVTATPLDANDQPMLAGSGPIPTPNFASTNSGRASVTPVSGVVTAIDNTDPIAPARVYATANGNPRSDSLDVVVRQRAVSIVISGVRTDTISSIGATKNYVAVARDANNRDLPPSFISWSTTDQTIAQANGGPPVVVTGISVGATRLAASRPADNVGDTITLVVTNDPATIVLLPDSLAILSLNDTVQFASVTVRNTKGDVLPGAPITWISLNPAVVEAVPDGRMVSHTLGSTFVIARTANGLADTSRVVVTNAPETLNIIPIDTTMTATGDTITVPVDFRNSRGVALPPSAASWSSSDPSIARVTADGSGRVIAMGTGDAYVLAVSPVNPVRRDSVLVTVTNEPAAMVTSPSTAQTLTAFGATLQFAATVFNAKGNPIPNATVRWTVPSGAAFVSVDSVSGLLTAVANGGAVVRGRSGTVTVDIPVTVAQAVSPSRSTIIPARNSIAADGADTTTVTIQLRDANDNNFAGTATVIPSTSRGTLSAFTNQGNGTYTVLLTAGTQSGPASIAATVNSVAISNTALVQFLPGTATQYVVVILPNASPLAGDNVTVVAQLADQFGNPVTSQVKTVTWSSTNGGTFTPSTPQTTSNGRVIVTFTTSTTPGTVHTLTATDNTTPTALTGSSALLTRSGGPTRYLVTTNNLNPVVGDSVTIVARLVDANGNFERIPGRTVTWSSIGGGGFASPTSVTDGDGLAWVRFGVSTVGGTNHRVTANDGVLQGTSPIFTTVVPTQYVMTAPATANAGTPILVTAQLADAGGNPVRQGGRTVAWTRAAGLGGNFATPTSLTDGNGLAVVAWTPTVSGINRIRATDQIGLTGVTGDITVGAGSAATLALTTQPSATPTAGAPFAIQPVLEVRDSFGNLITSDNSTVVTAARVAGTGTLGGTLTATAVNGVVSFADLQYTVAETITIGFSAPGVTGATSNNVVVGHAALSTFRVRASPCCSTNIGTQVAGTPFNLSLEARDAFGNRVTSFTGTVNITGGAGTTVLGEPVVSAAFTAGVVAAQSLAVTTAGSGKSIFVTNSAGTETGTSNLFDVNPGTLSNFLVEAQGGGAIGTQTAGTPFNIRVTARDAFGNTQTGFAGTVTFTSSSTVGAGAGPSASFIGGVLASHSITLNTSGSHTITATTGGGQNGTSSAFTINPTAPVSFTIAGSATQTAGASQTVTITARDAFGNPATSYAGPQDLVFAGATAAPNGSTPTATDNSATPITFGSPTSLNFVSGVATSSMTLYRVENISVSVSAAGPLNTPSPLNVTVSPAALSVFTVTAAGGGNVPNINSGQIVSLDITALDAFGNRQTSFVGTVNLTWVPNTAEIDFTPSTSTAFTNGQLLGFNMRIDDTSLLGLAIQDISIRVQSAGGQSGLSNIFTVN